MDRIERITSRSNPLVSHIRKLEKDRAYRREAGLFLCDGIKLYEEAPQGLLFLCRQPRTELPDRLTGTRYLVLDGLQDPGNVGTIWRTADAFGADGLILTRSCADPWSSKTVRATMGAAFRLPVWEAAPQELAAALDAAHIPLYGTALRADTVDLRTYDGSPAAVVIGNEGSGISEEVLSLCRQTWKIPMESKCESLNAAAAAAVVLWELYR